MITTYKCDYCGGSLETSTWKGKLILKCSVCKKSKEIKEEADGKLKLRKEVREFAEAMELKLCEEDVHRGDSWKRMFVGYLWSGLKKVWMDVIDHEEHDSYDDFVDLANYCMMLYHRKKVGEKQ